MKSKFLTISSIVAAIAASLCCIGPVVAFALGLGTFGLAASFESARPYLLTLTFLLLAGAFYRVYRQKPVDVCSTGVCKYPLSRRAQMLFLWLGAAVVVAFAAFPYYSGAAWKVLDRGSSIMAAQPVNTADGSITFTVDGMFCAGCAATVRSALSQLEGVHRADVDYDHKTAHVEYDTKRVTRQQLQDAVKSAGYAIAKEE